MSCETYARKGWDTLNQETRPAQALKDGMADVLATCLVEGGAQQNPAKLKEADRLLQGIDVVAVASLSGDSDVAADVSLTKAQLTFARAQYALSQTYVNEADTQLKLSPNPEAQRVSAVRALQEKLARKLSRTQ